MREGAATVEWGRVKPSTTIRSRALWRNFGLAETFQLQAVVADESLPVVVVGPSREAGFATRS